jgi:hypothetical protein
MAKWLLATTPFGHEQNASLWLAKFDLYGLRWGGRAHSLKIKNKKTAAFARYALG